MRTMAMVMDVLRNLDENERNIHKTGLLASATNPKHRPT